MAFTRATLTEIYGYNVGMRSISEPVSYSWHRGAWPHLPYGLSNAHTGHIIWTYYVPNPPCGAFSELSVLQRGWWPARCSSQEPHGMEEWSIRV